jgi:hypothetical protein
MAGFGINPDFNWTRFGGNALQDIGVGLTQSPTLATGFGRGAQIGQAQQPYRDATARLADEDAAKQKAIADQTALRAKYADFFTQQGSPDIAKGIADGILDPGEEYIKAITPKAPAAPIKVGAGETLVDPASYETLYTGPQSTDPKDAFNFEKDLAGQYNQMPPVKVYEEVKAGYERVRTSAVADSGAGDVGVVYGFMKMLDPGSVVREGEFATAEQTAGIPQQIVGLYNKLISGERLTPEQRQQFVTMADGLYAEAGANLNDINTQFSTRAGAWEVDPNRFIRQPEAFQPLTLQDAKTKYGLE